MEISKNDRLIQKLRSSSPSVVYQALVEIRTKEVNSANGVAFLRKSGALKYFVKFLQKPNEKILDVTLSILGNCCLENETRLELWRLGAVGPIVRILEGVGKDSIQGRTCRVLGNLAQLPEVAADICQEGAVPAIVAILGATSENNSNPSTENNASESTRQMAVRALRVLAVNPDYRSEILGKGGARAVAELLSSSNEELQKAAIKALVTLTQQCSEECANQVQGDDAFLEKLVSFVWDPNTADDPTRKKQLSSTLTEGALACLANLAHIPEVRPKLGNAGAVCALINQLRHVTSLEFCDEWKLRELVSTLCLFSRESVNRMKLRDNGGLNQLLILLKDDRHSPVAAALCNFVYDELGFRQLIDFGLIPICADRLRDVIYPKLRDNGRSHAFVSAKNENSMKKKPYFDNYLKGQKSRNQSISNQSAAVDDSIQNVSNLNLDQKLNTSFDENGKRLLKSPLKSSMQKTFRISSPSYQAIRHEQEGQKCSSPPSNSSPALFASGTWTHYSTDCHPPSSSAVGCALWPGNSASLSLNALFQLQGSMSPTSMSFSSSQFQDGLMSPEASSCCSGGSSSSCTSGYASSPRSDLSDAPSPSSGYSTTATNDSEEIYSPVYDDGSDDSGEDDLNLKDEDEKLDDRNTRQSCSKRLRKEDSFNGKDLSELKCKKKCSEGNVQASRCSSFLDEGFLKEVTLGLDFEADIQLLSEAKEKNLVEENEEKTKQDGSEAGEKKKNENSLVGHLLVLLSCASQLDDPVEELASYNTFSALLDYHVVNQDPAPRATRILTRIVKNEHYLIPLINQRFVTLVRSIFCLPFEHHINGLSLKNGRNSSPGKSGLQLCSECNRLNSLGMSLLMDLTSSAESGYGEGELAYGLLKGDESSRISISLSLPFIIREKRILRKLLMSCNGFAVLLDILRDQGSLTGVFPASVEPSEKTQKEDDKCLLSAAVDGLSYLANTLGISFNRKSSSKAVYKSTSSCINLEEMKSNDTTSENMQKRYLNHNADEVVFSLDDGSMVNVSRESVSSISPVFRAMLQGNFLESKEGNLIKLPGVSRFCLNYILHHLGECLDINCLNLSNYSKISSINDSRPSTESYGSCQWAQKPKEMYSALELVSISDRFLLPDTFRKRVADQVLDWYLCPKSAAKIYMWCIGSEGINGSKAPEDLGLLEGTLKFMLVGDMALSERVDLIKSVFEAGFGEELLSDVNDVIRMFIEP